MTIRTLIVDDEPVARRRIRRFLAEDAEVEVVGECSDGTSALEAVRHLAPELVFLDVRIPEVDGLSVLRSLPAEKRPVVVLVTAHDEYALQAFDAQALDYLLKPFDQERFRQALSRA